MKRSNHHNQAPTVIAIALFFITVASPLPAHASPVVYENYWGTKRADLMFHTEDEGYQPAPLLETNVKISITGPIARVLVRQKFHNPAQSWAEGIYVFPLTEGAAVDHMRLILDERVIEGQIHEKQKAKRIYNKAKREGKRASLLRQQRPNIFTTKVANIPPGGGIDIEIEYQQPVSIDSGEYSFRFPMVVAPRYIPGAVLHEQKNSGSGWADNTDVVRDASHITPPVQRPEDGPINPVRIAVDLAPGFAPDEVRSMYHKINSNKAGEGRYHLTIANEVTPADRDFVLTWRPSPTTKPLTALFTEQVGDQFFSLLMVTPPPAENMKGAIPPREVIYLIDRSGSMHGPSVDQAKSALLTAIKRLRPQDTFNIIAFNHMSFPLFGQPMMASPRNKRIAKRFIQVMQADGGTEMYGALQLALKQSTDSGGKLRQVIFLTDGAVGDEDRLLKLIESALGSTRLFPVGIGSAPNSHFMRKAAQFGRGDFTYIGDSAEVEEKMKALFKKIEAPALTDIKITLDESERGFEIYPETIPDLYLGRPVIVALKTKSAPTTVAISGLNDFKPWQTAVSISEPVSQSGVNVLYARRKIESLLDSMRTAPNQDESNQLRQAVVDTSILHHLVSKYTSLVAVDVTPGRPADEDLGSHAMKTNLPHGWKFGKVFGAAEMASAPMSFEMAQTATSAREDVFIGLLMLLGATLLWRMRGCKEQRK